MFKRLLPLAALVLATGCAQEVPLNLVKVTEPVYHDGHLRGTVTNNSDTTVMRLHFVYRRIATDGVVVSESTATAYLNVPSGQRRSYMITLVGGDTSGEQIADATWTLVSVTN